MEKQNGTTPTTPTTPTTQIDEIQLRVIETLRLQGLNDESIKSIIANVEKVKGVQIERELDDKLAAAVTKFNAAPECAALVLRNAAYLESRKWQGASPKFADGYVFYTLTKLVVPELNCTINADPKSGQFTYKVKDTEEPGKVPVLDVETFKRITEFDLSQVKDWTHTIGDTGVTITRNNKKAHTTTTTTTTGAPGKSWQKDFCPKFVLDDNARYGKHATLSADGKTLVVHDGDCGGMVFTGTDPKDCCAQLRRAIAQKQSAA